MRGCNAGCCPSGSLKAGKRCRESESQRRGVKPQGEGREKSTLELLITKEGDQPLPLGNGDLLLPDPACSSVPAGQGSLNRDRRPRGTGPAPAHGCDRPRRLFPRGRGPAAGERHRGKRVPMRGVNSAGGDPRSRPCGDATAPSSKGPLGDTRGSPLATDHTAPAQDVARATAQMGPPLAGIQDPVLRGPARRNPGGIILLPPCSRAVTCLRAGPAPPHPAGGTKPGPGAGPFPRAAEPVESRLPSTQRCSMSVSMEATRSPTASAPNTSSPTKRTFPQCRWIRQPRAKSSA